MSQSKYLKCPCQHCNGNIEFPVDAIGTMVDCPHCGRQTELHLPEPEETIATSHKTMIMAVAGVLILVIGLGAAFVALNAAKRMALKKQEAAKAAAALAEPTGPPAPPPPKDGLSSSTIELEKMPGSSLVYAVGTVTNDMTKRRFGLKIEIELLDSAGKSIGAAKAYLKVLDEGGEWHFRAMVMDTKAASARLGSIREEN